MINYFELEFVRVAAHRIEGKTEDTPYCNALPAQELMELDADTEYKLKEKLFDASDKRKKSFHLEIGDRGGASFFGVASKLADVSDREFISETGRIALMLGNAQDSPSHGPSYLITIQAKSADTGRYVFIAIKAEQKEAMVTRGGELVLIDDIILSPGTKMFKFGIIYKLEPWEKAELDNTLQIDELNREWGAFLFDDQFNPNSRPAAYFWREFLGFSLEHNGKIQTKHFYDACEKFAEVNIPVYSDRMDFIQTLDIEMTSTDEDHLDPKQYVHGIRDRMLADLFEQQVIQHMDVFEKDITLIESKLNRKTIDFPGKVKLSAPSAAMDVSIELIDTNDKLSELSAQQESYTIVKILGRPFTTASPTTLQEA